MMFYDHAARRFCTICGAEISHRGIAAKMCEECARKQVYAKKKDEPWDKPHEVNPQCEECEYFSTSSRVCNYSGVMDHTRLSLHKEEYRAAKDKAAFLHSLNNPCREFSPLPKPRRKKKGGATHAVE